MLRVRFPWERFPNPFLGDKFLVFVPIIPHFLIVRPPSTSFLSVVYVRYSEMTLFGIFKVLFDMRANCEGCQASKNLGFIIKVPDYLLQPHMMVAKKIMKIPLITNVTKLSSK